MKKAGIVFISKLFIYSNVFVKPKGILAMQRKFPNFPIPKFQNALMPVI
jgi:hypothetical protein